MKRTLSAATSVVVGGAGAVAFPAAAFAAPADQSAEEVAAQNATEAAMHTAGAAHTATQTVGDVVSAPEELAGGAKAQDPLAPVTDLAEQVLGLLTGLAPQQQQKSADALPDEVSGTLDSVTSQVPAVDQVAGQVTGESAPRSGLNNPLGEVNGLLGEGHSPVTSLTETLGGGDGRSLDNPELPTDRITGDLPVEDLAPVGPTLPTEQGERSAPQAVPGAENVQQAAGTAQQSAESAPELAKAPGTDGAQQPQVGPLNDLTSEEGPVGAVTGDLPVEEPTPENVSEVPQRLTGELPVDLPGGEEAPKASAAPEAGATSENEGPLHTDAVGVVGDVVQNGPLNNLPVG
ncbi:hypothetical protein [Bounagaea algeriensis]